MRLRSIPADTSLWATMTPMTPVPSPGPAPPVDRSLLDFAVDVAREAGESTLRWFRARDLAVDSKADGTPVTAADRHAERLVRDRVAARFPDDGVLGEEEPETAGATGRRWIVDPIDGTKAFTRGVPLYSTLLALDDEHGPAVGVIVLPALGQAVYAGRGLGAWCDGEPARVSATAALDGAYLSQQQLQPLARGRPPGGEARRAASCGPGATATATRSSPPAGSTPWSTTWWRSTTWRRCP